MSRAGFLIEFLKLNPDVKREYIVHRLDGRLEWTCEHGVGHTIWYPKNSSSTHGCDMCCRKLKLPEIYRD